MLPNVFGRPLPPATLLLLLPNAALDAADEVADGLANEAPPHGEAGNPYREEPPPIGVTVLLVLRGCGATSSSSLPRAELPKMVSGRRGLEELIDVVGGGRKLSSRRSLAWRGRPIGPGGAGRWMADRFACDGDECRLCSSEGMRPCGLPFAFTFALEGPEGECPRGKPKRSPSRKEPMFSEDMALVVLSKLR